MVNMGLHSFSRKNRTSLKLLVILFGICLQGNLISGQRVDVQPERATVKEGGSTTLTCRYGDKISFCLFNVPGLGQMSVNEQYNNNQVQYVGNGLQNGECGITINRVLQEYNGEAKCTLGVTNLPQGVIEGKIQIVVARPGEPTIQVESSGRNGVLNTDKPLRAACTVERARPKADIKWFLNDEPITQGLSNIEFIEKDPEEFTSFQRIEYRLSPQDNGKKLICKAVQFNDDAENKISVFPLDVQYAPVPQQDIHVYGLDLGHTASVNVTIQANPAPQVSWMIEGQEIQQGSQNGRFAVYQPTPLGNGYYNVTLLIGGLTLEDTVKAYYFKASNSQGSRDYTVRISSSDKPLATTGLEVGAIVGIVVACLVILIIIVLVTFARLTGRWCFAGATLNTDIGPDSEAQIHPGSDDKDFDGEENMNSRPQSEEVTPPVTDKLDSQKKADIKNGQPQNGKEAKTNTSV